MQLRCADNSRCYFVHDRFFKSEIPVIDFNITRSVKSSLLRTTEKAQFCRL